MELYPIAEASELLKIGYSRLAAMAKGGRIGAVKRGRRRFIPRSEIDRIMSQDFGGLTYEQSRIRELEEQVAALQASMAPKSPPDSAPLPRFLAGAAQADVREFRIRDCPPCVYFLLLRGEIVYVGQSISLASRVSEHLRTKIFDRVVYCPIIRSEMDRVEAALIRELRPKLNGMVTARVLDSVGIVEKFVRGEYAPN